MSVAYQDRDGDMWYWDANNEGYYTGDMWDFISLDQLKDRYGPLAVHEEGSSEFVPEPESQEQLFRRVVREELDRRFGRVHT
ncbi:hypothetical protein OG306_33275 [Streptomyces sp. NBC_01241]|uniref:hypothetical protein n=1 Tax=Streptomyces sp. NBC_01241 TaxID=2903794 RepID=UPI00352D7563|nr:hypothetical protein OG306_33275 [Streptomyces sp. NBC_01241]